MSVVPKVMTIPSQAALVDPNSNKNYMYNYSTCKWQTFWGWRVVESLLGLHFKLSTCVILIIDLSEEKVFIESVSKKIKNI
jgi:hypothetical protein